MNLSPCGSYTLSRILDLSFNFFTMWHLRIVPSLFLRDMHRALSVPRSERPPRTPHYSPMLHNAILSLSAVFSDDQRIRDARTRQYFAKAAKACLEAECQRPDISLVHALAFLATYHGNKGDRIISELYCGASMPPLVNYPVFIPFTGMCSRITISRKPFCL